MTDVMDVEGPPARRFDQRVVLVTGAARGIGLGIARRLAGEGACVALVDIDPVGVSAALADLDDRTTIAIAADVTSEKDIERAVAAVIARWGRIDVLVNNAGITGPAKPTWEYTPDEWRHVIDVDLLSVFLLCRAVVPIMITNRRGRIVNIASISGKEGNPNMAAYSSAKAGVIGLTKALAKELAGREIIVNCVTPAVIETTILSQLTAEAVTYMVNKIPMGRTGTIEEVAAIVAFAASDECSFTTGAVFDISGGRATY